MLFATLIVSAPACTNAPSTASEYLAKSKKAAESGDQVADDSKDGDNDADDNSGGNGGSSGDGDTPVDDGSDPGDPVDPDPMDPDPMDPEPGEPKVATYAEINTKIFAKYCTNCHGTKGGVNVESYSKVKAQLSAIKDAVLVAKTMPEGANQPSADELELLSDWIEAGAPEN